MKHDKEHLTKEEKCLADCYYKLEKEKIDLEKIKNKTNEHKTQISNIKKEMKKMNKDVDKFRINVYHKIIDKFNEIGYNVEFKLHNSANFGVPQKRERVIFIGTNTNIKIKFPNESHEKEGKDLPKWISVREAIDDLKDLEEDKTFSQIYTKHTEAFIEKIANTEIGKSVNKKYTEAFFRCKPSEPSPTVKENHGGVFVHYEKNRVMTPRELARLQSFPDNFIFKGTKSSILKQLGNAVPCGLSEAIAESVLDSLTNL